MTWNADLKHVEKVRVVFMDVVLAYDTVWHRGLNLKLLNLIPNLPLVDFVMKMLHKRRRKLVALGGSGLTLAPMLFNVYVSNISQAISDQYGYADDLALHFSNKN